MSPNQQTFSETVPETIHAKSPVVAEFLPVPLDLMESGVPVWYEGFRGRAAIEIKASLKRRADWMHIRPEFYRWWATEHPLEALADAQKEDPAAITVNTAAVVSGWLYSDNLAALNWVHEQPDTAEKPIFAQAILAAVSPVQLPYFSSWLRELLELPGGRRLPPFVASRIRERDVNAAVDYVRSWEAAESRTRGTTMKEFFLNWATEAPKEASECINALEAGLFRDKAVVTLVEVISNEDADSAQKWAESIKDDGLRTEALGLLEQVSAKAN